MLSFIFALGSKWIYCYNINIYFFIVSALHDISLNFVLSFKLKKKKTIIEKIDNDGTFKIEHTRQVY